jgi:hypothetical protein
MPEQNPKKVTVTFVVDIPDGYENISWDILDAMDAVALSYGDCWYQVEEGDHRRDIEIVYDNIRFRKK